MTKYIITIDGKKYEVGVEKADPNAVYTPAAKVDAPAPKKEEKQAPAAAPAAPAAAGDGTKVSAPLPGTILKIVASQGQDVKKGAVLCVLEAMKMENDIVAPVDGKVVSVSTTQGASVNTGDLLFVIG